MGPRRIASLIALLCLSLSSVLALADPDLEKGKQAYGVCVACHGADGAGNAALNAPRIAGQEAWYLRRQLENFKSGIRGTHEKDIYGQQMRPMAMTLADDAAIDNVVAYVATLDAPAPEDSAEGDAEAGKSAYAACAACHGADGGGNEALNAPGLAGQHGWYIARQLANFKAGVRGTHEKDVYGQQMRPMAMTLPDEAAIANVTAYIESLD